MPQPIGNLLLNGANPAVVTIPTSTSVVYFPLTPGPSIGVATTSPVAGFIPFPGANRGNGQYFNARICGSFLPSQVAVSCPTVQVGLYYTTSTIQAATLASIKSFVVPAAQATQHDYDTAYGFRMNVDISCDNDSQLLQGAATLQFDGAANVTATGLVTNINPSLDQPFALCVGVTFSVAGTTASPNIAKLYQFDLSQ